MALPGALHAAGREGRRAPRRGELELATVLRVAAKLPDLPKASARALLGVVDQLVNLGDLSDLDTSGGVSALVPRIQRVHRERVALLERYLTQWREAVQGRETDPRTKPRPLALAVAAAARGRSGPEADPRDQVVSLLQVEAAGERFSAESLASFLDLMRPAEAAARDAGQRAGQWVSLTKALLACSPLDVQGAATHAEAGEAHVACLREVAERFPDRILVRRAALGEAPLAGRVADDDDPARLSTPGPESEAGRIRLALEAACAATQRAATDAALAVQAWCETLRERAGLTSGPFVVLGLPADDQPLRQAAGGAGLAQPARVEGDEAESGNRGRYRRQAPLLLAERIVVDALAQIARVRPADAAELRQRAAALLGTGGLTTPDPAWTLLDVLGDPARAVLALGLHAEARHVANREPRYSAGADLYRPEHELSVWRALSLLESLSRGTPEQPDLRWSFSLTDSTEQVEDGQQIVKTVHVWDGTRPLVQQRGAAGPRFWRGFWGDPPVGPTRRVVFDAALQAAIELLAERQAACTMNGADRRHAGLALRSWVPDSGLPVADILGLRLDASADDALCPTSGEAPRRAAPTRDEASAALVAAQGQRLAEALQTRLAQLSAAPPPHLRTLLPAISGREIVFDAAHASIRLVGRPD